MTKRRKLAFHNAVLSETRIAIVVTRQRVDVCLAFLCNTNNPVWDVRSTSAVPRQGTGRSQPLRNAFGNTTASAYHPFLTG